MNNTELRELLVDKYDYMNSQVDGVLLQINEFSPKVACAFNAWLDTGKIDDTQIEGYTVKSILHQKPMKIVAAYLTLSWLEKNPSEAKRFLRRKEILNSAATRDS